MGYMLRVIAWPSLIFGVDRDWPNICTISVKISHPSFSLQTLSGTLEPEDELCMINESNSTSCRRLYVVRDLAGALVNMPVNVRVPRVKDSISGLRLFSSTGVGEKVF